MASQLSEFLNSLQSDFHRTQFLSSDPLEFVHLYEDPWDQEAVALLAAVLAYGNVKQIRRSIQNALNRIQEVSSSPKEFVRNLCQTQIRKKADQVFSGYVHRFNQGSDLVLLFTLLGQSWARYGSLGGHFTTYLRPDAADISDALSALIQDWMTLAAHETGPGAGPKSKSTFSYLLTSPANGSCCKRWCMLLRWMGRSDQVDPGLWTQSGKLASTIKNNHYLKASQLVMPLDTHTGRISQYLGLTSRKSLNWQAAIEVTQALKKVDPQDPTRYDFALSRLGILDICQRTYRKEICKRCQLLPACKMARQKLSQKLP